MKKAQTEIIGLAVIVLLVSIAILFALQFIIMKQPTDITKEYTYKELAANTLSTALKTTTDCNNMQLDQIVTSCILGESTLPCSPYQNPCIYATEVFNEIFDNTLEKWNMNYYLLISGTQSSPQITIGTPCTGETTPSSPCCPLPNSIMAKLDICS